MKMSYATCSLFGRPVRDVEDFIAARPNLMRNTLGRLIWLFGGSTGKR